MRLSIAALRRGLAGLAEDRATLKRDLVAGVPGAISSVPDGMAAGSVLEGVPTEARPRALFLLTLIAGALMITAGILKLGRYTRFVPHSVMIGFLTGVACFSVPFSACSSAMGDSIRGGTPAKQAQRRLHFARFG